MQESNALIAKQKKESRKHQEKVNQIKYQPKLDDVIQHLRIHSELLQLERNKYTAEKLMMLLDNEKLSALEEEFGEHQIGIDLTNFIWLMKCAIVHPQEEKYELVNGLIKLFHDIDINGDRHMEWSEFTQYIIDAVIGEKEAKFFDARFEKDRELTEIEILDRAYSRKTKRYVQSKYFDNSTHANLIKKVQFTNRVDLVLCLEQNSNKIKYYTAECQEFEHQKKKLQFQIPYEEGQPSFVVDFNVAESLGIVGLVTSDRQMIFYENTLSLRQMKNVKLDVLQTGIWYLENHKFWITAGADYNIRTWTISPNDDRNKIEPDMLIIAHSEQITDICELTQPKLVASCSLDKRIRLWDLTDSAIPICKTELKDTSGTNRGIRGMTYSSYYGSNLLSFGFDNYINIWCPEVSITRAYIGKLEGHSSIVIICKFIQNTPNVISIDDKNNIRIWDIRSMSAIQVINSDSNFSVQTDLAVITGKHDKFVVGGKRLVYYENAAATKNMKSLNDDITALNVEFNSYFNLFVVLTKIDVRCYDAMTGKLKRVFNEVHDEKFSVDLSTFCFGGRERKFYVGDNAGLIRQYNMKNGQFLKQVNQLNEIDQSEFSKKQDHIKKKDNNEVSRLIYIQEEKLLISSFWDSTIRIYDESDAEESQLMKVLSGGHKETEITCLTYSSHLSLLASGSVNGFITLWDFETGKPENVLLADDSEVTGLEFGDPYPVLLSASINGTVSVWGVRNCPNKFRYKCILKIVNSMWSSGHEQRHPILSLMCDTYEQEGIAKELINDDFRPPVSFRDPVIKKLKPDRQTKKQNYLTHDKVIQDSDRENHHAHEDVVYEGQQSISSEQQSECRGEAGGDQQQPGDGPESPLLRHAQRSGSAYEIVSDHETVQDFLAYHQSYDSSSSSVRRRLYVYVGDAKGFIHVWHLTDILKKRDILPLREEKKKQSFQLRRKDLINAKKYIENLLSSQDRKNEQPPLQIHAYGSVLIKRWQPHTGQVSKLIKIMEQEVQNPKCICNLSCSADKQIKFWSQRGELLCKINLVKFDQKDFVWRFPFDWIKQKLNDIELVFDSLFLIENEKLSDQEKDNIRMKFLVNKFFRPDTMDKLQEEIRNREQKTDAVVKEVEKPKYTYHLKDPLDSQKVIELKIQELKELEKNDYQSKGVKSFLQQSEANQEEIKKIKTFYGLGGLPLEYSEHIKDLAEKLDERICYGSTDGRPKKTVIQQSEKEQANKEKHYKISYKSKNHKKLQLQSNDKKQSRAEDEALLQKVAPMSNQSKLSYMDNKPQTSSSMMRKHHQFSLSTSTLLKNNAFVNNLIKASRPQTQAQQNKFDFVKDVKYKLGEAKRQIRVATNLYSYKLASDSPNIIFGDNDVLQKKFRFYKELNQPYKNKYKDKNDYFDDDDEDDKQNQDSKKKGLKIVASSNFLYNPNRNKHKILKAKDKIYVIEQQD